MLTFVLNLGSRSDKGSGGWTMFFPKHLPQMRLPQVVEQRDAGGLMLQKAAASLSWEKRPVVI